MFRSDNKLLLFSVVAMIFTLYLSPLIFFGENSFVLIHDNLDSNVIWFKILAKSGKLFSSNSSIIPNIMNGLPRSCFLSEYNFIQLLYCLFPPFTAYVINLILIHLIAFIGSFLLLERYLLKGENLWLIGLSALCFSLLPFWPSGGLGIAGQPLLIYVFLNFLKEKVDKSNYLIVVLIPFYSSLIFSQLFLFVFLAGYGLWCWRRKEGNYKHFFKMLFIISLIHLLIEYRFILIFLFGQGFISHRTEFAKEELNLHEVVSWAFAHFKNGQYHSESLQFPFLFILVGLALFFGLYCKDIKAKRILFFLCLAGSISFFYKLLIWGVFVNSGFKINLFKVFQVERFYTLFPLIWLLITASSLNLLVEKRKKIINVTLYSVLTLQLFYCFWSFDSFRITYFQKIVRSGDSYVLKPNEYPSYKEYYSSECFTKIKNFIGKDQAAYRIVNIGIDPSITLYNGFYNLDAYMPNYPVAYKHEFRSIIEKELDKDPSLKKNFDTWGSRCYIFAAEMNKPELNNLELNFGMLKSMNCSFIFSSKKINNLENNIALLETFSGHYIGKVYVYKVL